mmetsp:Transcript_29898/g.60674  ORF Transcript_29898/g.60674 Transcript_29898/m.60674 type:complete len:93 (+) Transcript_29898:2219-2497(+)
MGIRCALSRGLALGFHTGKGVTFGGASYDTGPSSTGVGHFHFEKVRMNMRSSLDAGASSFLCINGCRGGGTLIQHHIATRYRKPNKGTVMIQ